jgi:chemotaxis protein MotB
VEGHTDSDPIKKSKWESNAALSAARAQAVAACLVKECDFPGDAVSTTGYGSTRPITDNDTREAKARNRRIELVLVSRTR